MITWLQGSCSLLVPSLCFPCVFLRFSPSPVEGAPLPWLPFIGAQPVFSLGLAPLQWRVTLRHRHTRLLVPSLCFLVGSVGSNGVQWVPLYSVWAQVDPGGQWGLVSGAQLGPVRSSAVQQGPVRASGAQ